MDAQKGRRARIVSLLLLACALVFAAYHFYKFNEIQFNLLTGYSDAEHGGFGEIYLLDQDDLANENSTFTVYASEKMNCELCGVNGSGSVKLEKGENELSYAGCLNASKAMLTCGSRSVSSGFSRGNAESEFVKATLAARVENRTVYASLKGNGFTNGEKRLAFAIDGKTVFEPRVDLNGDFELNEWMNAVPGKHVLSVSFQGKPVSEQEFEAPQPFDWTLAIVAAACLLAARAISKNKLAFSLLFIVLLAVSFVLHFRLENYGFWWITPFALLAIALFAYRKNKEGKCEVGIEKNVCLQGFVFALFIALFVLVQASMAGNTDVWGAYYFRHVQEAFNRGTTDYVDSLSYLGRNFTYTPVFFEFSAQAMKLFGLSSVDELQTPLAIAVVFAYAFTLFLLFAKFDGKKRWLAALIFFAEWSMLYMATGVTIQVFSYTLLNIAVLLTPRPVTFSAPCRAALPSTRRCLEAAAGSSQPNAARAAFAAGALPILTTAPHLSQAYTLAMLVFAIASLGLSIAAHPTSLVLYPFYLLVLEERQVDWKRGGIVFVGACVFALAFIAPIFLKNGLVTEIVPTKWGYLLAYGLEGMQYDFQFLVPIMVVSIAYGLCSKKTVQSLALLALFAANAFISSRVNLLLGFASAAFIPIIFEQELKDRKFLFLLVGIILLNYITSPVIASGTKWWCSWGMANDWCTAPMKYVEKYAAAEEVVALNPYFGHLEARFGGRPVVADLYVEWADYEKWKAENDFYEQSNASFVEKYNVTLFILDDLHQKRSLEKDRVYDNGFAHVFR